MAVVSVLWARRGVWLGLLAGFLALVGMRSLPVAGARSFSDLLFVLAAVLCVVAWVDQRPVMHPGVVAPVESIRDVYRDHHWRVEGVVLSVLAAVAADLRFVRYPSETFGLAGTLWLLGVFGLLAATIPPARYRRTPARFRSWARHPSRPVAGWLPSEMWIVVAITGLALALRVWDLRDIPYAIHPDEIMTGRVALRAYGGPQKSPIFSTIWPSIDLSALWFTVVAASLAIFGHTLSALRLPVALVGGLTIIPFYALVRDSWGRVAATAGTFIFAVTAVDIHFSRVTVNNRVTPLFWVVCFFFLLRGVSHRRAFDWSAAGIAAGLSEHAFYGTRLLTFILIGFCLYLLVIHRRWDRQSLAHYGLLIAGYVVAFGPLLAYFLQHPHLYLGRGQGALIWQHGPNGVGDLLPELRILWKPVSQNLLAVSTISDSGGFYWGSLLLPVEAALLLLGTALLTWRWRNPPEFLMLLSGLGTLFVGGTLVLGAPALQDWTPAFPAIFAAIALPISAWGRSVQETFAGTARTGCYVLLGIGLFVVAGANFNYYFRDYDVTRPEFEIRAAQSRWEAGLGVRYRVFAVGPTWQPYDRETNGYLIHGQVGGTLLHPKTELPLRPERGKGLGFVFIDDEKRYIPLVHRLYPHGRSGEVHSHGGVHLFYTYTVSPH